MRLHTALILAAIFAAVLAPPATAQIFKVLHTFTGTDGANPSGTLIRDSAGDFYGTTGAGGAAGFGTVYKLDSAGAVTVLYSFMNTPDGATASGGLIRDSTSNLYGTTVSGGDPSCGCGTVFRIDAGGVETVLHRFLGGSGDGNGPHAGLVMNGPGKLVGTTSEGGTYGKGTVFQVTTAGESVLYNFGAQPGAGWLPDEGPLLRDSAGNLFGQTFQGGSSAGLGDGTVYKLASDGSETVLHSFSGADGKNPEGSLTKDSAGNLYGTTMLGGTSARGIGVVFELDSAGNETVLYSFNKLTNGDQPFAGLVRDAAGNLYGTTVFGGAFNLGTVFKIDANGVETVLHSFSGSKDGSYPYAPLLLIGGTLYGTAVTGGANNDGVVFALKP